MKSGDGQKHLTSELSAQEPAFCIHVLKHRGRTDGQGASGIGVPVPGGEGLTVVLANEVVDEVSPPVGVLGTHCPFFISSLSLQVGAGEEEVVVVTSEVDEVVTPPVSVSGTQDPWYMVDPVEQAVVAPGVEEVAGVVVVDVTPPVGVFGTQRPF